MLGGMLGLSPAPARTPALGTMLPGSGTRTW